MRGNGGIIGEQNNPTTSVASGIWSLREVTSAVKNSIWPSRTYDYEQQYGTPDYTITSFPSTDSGVTSTSDLIVAVDANISSTDDGVLFDLGGSGGAGCSAGVNNGTIRFRAFDSAQDSPFTSGNGQAWMEVNISSYTGSFATYYFVVFAEFYTIAMYVQPGGRGSTTQPDALGGDSADGSQTTVYGSNDKGYGRSNSGIADLGTAYEVDFNGTIDEIRIWTEDASLDASTFGS